MIDWRREYWVSSVTSGTTGRYLSHLEVHLAQLL